MARILIIDDDHFLCDALNRAIQRMGEHESQCALNLTQGLKTVNSAKFDVVLLDVGLPDGNGLSAMSQIQQSPGEPQVIIITGASDAEGADLAIKNGAWDYIQKASSPKAMTLPILRALEYRKEKQAQPFTRELDRAGILGSSPKILECLELLAQAANSQANVLLIGETGTGKELFAKALHVNSIHADKPFEVVDCTTLPENLVESLLFGHEQGAFTGANRNVDGLIKQANGGILFLDEVGELPLSVQKAFLRVLQTGIFRPLGSNKEIHSRFRVVAATNRNLREMAQEDKFRKDLLYRLQSITIHLPPLRERPEDIREIALHYTFKLCQSYRLPAKAFSPDFLEYLTRYPWPGNVRELVNTLERVIAVARDEKAIFPAHLPPELRAEVTKSRIAPDTVRSRSKPSENASGLCSFAQFRKEMIESAEAQYLIELVKTAAGDIRKACAISGLSRSRLYELLQKHDISLKHGLLRPPDSHGKLEN